MTVFQVILAFASGGNVNSMGKAIDTEVHQFETMPDC